MRQEAILDFAQPGEAIRPVSAFAVSGLLGLPTDAMVALVIMLLRPLSAG